MYIFLKNETPGFVAQRGFKVADEASIHTREDAQRVIDEGVFDMNKHILCELTPVSLIDIPVTTTRKVIFDGKRSK